MEGDDYIGHCVNLAARLCDLAEGGESLADPSVVEALPRWGAARGHEDIALRGIERPVSPSSIAMDAIGPDHLVDPICGLPMSPATAEETSRHGHGELTLFCSVSCLDTWRNRPAASAGTN